MTTLIVSYYKGHSVDHFHYFELRVSHNCPSQMEIRNNRADSHVYEY